MTTERGIDERPNGRFRVRVKAGNRNFTKTHATLAEAMKWRDGLYVELNDETMVPVEGMSLADIRGPFLALRKKLRNYKTDRSRFDTHLATTPFARLALTALRRRDVIEWAESLEEKNTAHKWGERPVAPLSRSSRKHCVNLLRSALQFAVDREIIVANVAKDIRVGGDADPIPDDWFLSPEEQAKVAAAETVERWIALFAIGTGLRQGEQWNLRLVDVHTTGSDPHVVVRFGSEGNSPKSKRARVVPLFGLGLEAAKAWVELLPSYAKHNPVGLMFPTERGARRGRSKTPRQWKAIVTAVGRHVHWHLLRHTAASSLVAGWWGRQWTLEEVKVFMGHSSITVTERYAHLARTRLHAVATETQERYLSTRRPVVEKAAGNGSPSRPSKPNVGGSNPSGRARGFSESWDDARTTILAALAAVERADPTALRQAVDALAVALAVGDELVAAPTTDAVVGT